MAIPTYESFMLPLLRWVSDGATYRMTDAYATMATEFGLTDADKSQLLQSGQPVYYNRVGWAKTYMDKAGLLEKVKQGHFRITAEGQALLRTNPTKIDGGVLRRYPSFLQFQQKPPLAIPVGNGIASSLPLVQTPEEAIENAFTELNNGLAQDILIHVLKQSPAFFERLVVDLLLAMGYGGTRKDAGATVGKSGDGGVDGIIKQDRLGLDAIYIQAKRWGLDQTVGRPDIQGFVGALSGNAATKGIFITTSKFSKEARFFVEKVPQRIILIDGETLAQYMIEFNIGVSATKPYVVKRIDSDYFEEEA